MAELLELAGKFLATTLTDMALDTRSNVSTLPYSQKGGARVGRSEWWAINYTTPFAQITVAREHILLAIGTKLYRFEPEVIETLEVFNGFISTGVKLNHSSVELPTFVVFWTVSGRNLDTLKSVLNEAGYKISG